MSRVALPDRQRAGASGLRSSAASIAKIVLLALALGPALASEDARFVPRDDSVIVERLRERPLEYDDLVLRQARAQLRSRPSELSLALVVAQRSIAIARRDGDPRYLGFAQAALAPWTAQAKPPAQVRLLRAILLQSTHQFAPALAELDRLVLEQPQNVQALLTRASILQVLGRYGDAAASCQRLFGLGAGFYATVCLAELESLTGRATEGHRRLTALTSTAREASEASWLALVMAEMEERGGEFRSAERHYREALLENPDVYVKAAYADFLLDRGRAPEVVKLLEREQRADALLLRLALAYRALRRPELAGAVATLQARFGAARLRGDRVHLREEARFELALLDRPRVALRLAMENWAVQKEPADARIFLESSEAAREIQQAAPVVSFLRANHTTDQRLAKWLR